MIQPNLRLSAISTIISWRVLPMADADRCVCCGEIVPEGRQVCPQCENGVKQNGNKKTTIQSMPIISTICKRNGR